MGLLRNSFNLLRFLLLFINIDHLFLFLNAYSSLTFKPIVKIHLHLKIEKKNPSIVFLLKKIVKLNITAIVTINHWIRESEIYMLTHGEQIENLSYFDFLYAK